MNKKIVIDKLLFVSYEAVGLILNIHAKRDVTFLRFRMIIKLSQLSYLKIIKELNCHRSSAGRATDL